MVAPGICSIGDTVFLGKIRTKRRGMFNKGVILY